MIVISSIRWTRLAQQPSFHNDTSQCVVDVSTCDSSELSVDVIRLRASHQPLALNFERTQARQPW
jgi:siroheme synthase